MGLYRRKDSKFWWISYSRGGKQFHESSGSERKGDAKDLLARRQGDIVRGLPVSPKVNRLKWDEALQDVVNDYATNGRRSAEAVERRARLHLTPFFEGRQIASITTTLIRSYVAARLEKKAKNATINRELAILKRAFSLAMKAGTVTVRAGATTVITATYPGANCA